MGYVVNATPRPLYPCTDLPVQHVARLNIIGNCNTMVNIIKQDEHNPLYRRLRGFHGRSGRMRKISPPPGFDPRTV